MKLGELDEAALVLIGVNAVAWTINISLMGLYFIK